MKGYIQQRGTNTWKITVDVTRDVATGKRIRHYETIKGNREDAQQRLAELHIELSQGTYVKAQRVTLAQWLRHWLDTYAAPNLSPKTLESYTDEVRRHIVPALGMIRLDQLRPHHIQNYIDLKLSSGNKRTGQGLSNRTVYYQLSILSKSLSDACKQGMISINPAKSVTTPRPRQRDMPTMGDDDMNRLLSAMRESPYFLHFYTLLCTGLRRGELLGLRWLNVDLELAQVYVTRSLDRLGNGAYIIKRPKSPKSRRAIDIPPSLCVLLQDHKAQQASQNHEDLVFGSMDPRTLSHAFHKMAQRAGLDLRLHDLRHLHAMLMLKQGIHPKVVQERLGHSSINMTLDTYNHMVPGLHKAAAQSFDTILQGLRKSVAIMSPGSHNTHITAG